mmetsp:Transcript_8863/g.16942  ORF Transcript_8863/g.16942 Transcript_8863/m.16942 type:complete len:247 (-) Transcript_8863:1541-2281(-)
MRGCARSDVGEAHTQTNQRLLLCILQGVHNAAQLFDQPVHEVPQRLARAQCSSNIVMLHFNRGRGAILHRMPGCLFLQQLGAHAVQLTSGLLRLLTRSLDLGFGLLCGCCLRGGDLDVAVGGTGDLSCQNGHLIVQLVNLIALPASELLGPGQLLLQDLHFCSSFPALSSSSSGLAGLVCDCIHLFGQLSSQPHDLAVGALGGGTLCTQLLLQATHRTTVRRGSSSSTLQGVNLTQRLCKLLLNSL